MARCGLEGTIPSSLTEEGLLKVLDLADNDHLILVKADLEDGSPWPMSGKTFDAVVVANYLWRDLFPHLVAALASGGFFIY